MEFCNKGMVRADPLPPSYGQRPYFYIFFLLDPSLSLRWVQSQLVGFEPIRGQGQSIIHLSKQSMSILVRHLQGSVICKKE